MNVTERIQRLREETARAADGSWEVTTDEPGGEYLDVDGPLGGWVARTDSGYPATSAHIARWDPQAAARALDLLDHLFRWPHFYSDAALERATALLDTIDPEGAAT